MTAEGHGSTGDGSGTATSGESEAERERGAACRVADWDRPTLERIAETYGTPTYVVDLDRVVENYERLDAAFPEAHLCYAAKANTRLAVLRTLYEAGADIEVAAAGAMHRAREAGVPLSAVRYTAVNPPAGDLDYFVERWREEPGLTVTVGAETTLDRLAERGFDGRVAIRVNPSIGAGHHEKVATGADAKFGIPYDRVPDLVEDARERFDVVGLHMHIGSGMLDDDLDRFGEAVAKLSRLAREVGPLEFVDVGGGLGIPYREDEPPLDPEGAAETVREAFDADATLVMEPGRYLVGDAGVVLARVNTRKETPETTVVGVDASLATLIRPAMFDSYHPITNVTDPDRPAEPVTVGGPVCSSADTFCQGRPIARPERRDLLAIGNAGAYGYDIANQFMSQPRPAVVALEGGEDRLLRERETFADLHRGERP